VQERLGACEYALALRQREVREQIAAAYRQAMAPKMEVIAVELEALDQRARELLSLAAAATRVLRSPVVHNYALPSPRFKG
jgi:hypothetical protein